MPLPDRPVDAADIETAWGQAVHDWTFAPVGCDLDTATTRTVDNTAGGLQCHLDTVNNDPAGFLDAPNDQAVVPAGMDGLYLLNSRLNSVNGSVGDGFQTRQLIYLNGSAIASSVEDNAGGTNIVVTVTALVALSALDELQVFAQRKGAGTNPTVHVLSFQLLRLGSDYGA